jgi:PTS system nitrogen regulatory IIA component
MDKTFYSIRTISEKLAVSEKTIYRMLSDNQIPFAVKIGGQWRFRSDAIDAWIIGRSSRNHGSQKTDTGISIYDALQQGSMLYRIHGANRDECINELLATLPYSPGIDQKALKVSLFARESLASSSMQGIACMGISDEQPIYTQKSMVLLAFLEKPADFKALDGNATEAFFLVLPANRGEQALLETRLTRLLQEDSLRAALNKQPPRPEILELIRQHEDRIFKKKAAGRSSTSAPATS